MGEAEARGGREARGEGGGRGGRRAPDDEDAVAALRLQLRKLLEEDTRLAGDLAAIWQKAEAANVVQVTASGERSVAVGGDVTGSTIVTGDQAPSEG